MLRPVEQHGARRVAAQGCWLAVLVLGNACGGVSTAPTPAPTPGPTGRFLFGASESSATVRGWSIDPMGGRLAAIGEIGLGGGARALSIAVEPAGRFLYVARSGGRGGIDVFAIDHASGALEPAPGSPFDLDHQADDLRPDRSGRFLFAFRTFNSRVDVFTVDPSTGALSPQAAFDLLLPVAPIGPLLRPDGRFLYFGVGGLPQVMSAAVDPSSGRLAQGTVTAVQDVVRSLAASPSSAFLYVTTATPFSSNTLFAFRISPDTGALTSLNGPAFAPGFDATAANLRPGPVTFDPVGRFAYILDRAGRTGAHSLGIFVFPVQSNGAFGPSFLGPFSTPAVEPFLNGDPVAFVIDPSGRFAYLADATSGAISSFMIDPRSGGLSVSGTSVPAPGLPGAPLLAIAP